MDHWLLRANADLTPAIIAKAIAKRLKKRGLAPEGSDIAARMDQRLRVIEAKEREMAKDPRASTPDFDDFLGHVPACRK